MGDKDFIKPLLERRGTVFFGKVRAWWRAEQGESQRVSGALRVVTSRRGLLLAATRAERHAPSAWPTPPTRRRSR